MSNLNLKALEPLDKIKMPLTFNESYSKYRYHWLWGIEPCQPAVNHNIKERLEAYQNQPELLHLHIAQVKKIQSYSPFIKAFYWLFNVNAYAERYFLLSLFLKQAQEEKHANFLSEFEILKDSVFMKQVNQTNFSNLSQWFSDCSPWSMTVSNQSSQEPVGLWDRFKQFSVPYSFSFSSPSNDVSQEIEITPLLSEQRMSERMVLGDSSAIVLPTKESSAEEVEERFSVTAAMLASLQILGFKQVNIGEVLLFKDFKSAYHKQALKTHPDKHLGHETEFHAIQAAYETIKGLLTSDEDASMVIFKAAFARMDEELREISRKSKALWQGIQELRQEQAELRQGFAEISKGQAEIRQEQAEIRQGFVEVGQGQAENQSALDGLQDGEEQIWRMLNELQCQNASTSGIDGDMEAQEFSHNNASSSNYLSPAS